MISDQLNPEALASKLKPLDFHDCGHVFLEEKTDFFQVVFTIASLPILLLLKGFLSCHLKTGLFTGPKAHPKMKTILISVDERGS